MADPIGIISGVVGIAMSTLHVAGKLKELIDGIQGAPEAVKALSKDLHALQGVLEALNSLLEDSRFTERRLCAEAMPALEPHLHNCTTTLDSISMAIARHTKPSGDPKKSKWSGFIWYFREKEILTLQNRLTTYKMSLDLAVSVATLYVLFVPLITGRMHHILTLRKHKILSRLQ
jgi:Fungal N-terminal domain of STAND proteins